MITLIVVHGFYKDRNRVYLRGCFKGTNATFIHLFKLPVEYRPTKTVGIATVFGFTGTLQAGLILIANTGEVTVGSLTTASKEFVTLDGISFLV